MLTNAKSLIYSNLGATDSKLSTIQAQIKATHCQIDAVTNICRTKKCLAKSVYAFSALSRGQKKTQKKHKLNSSLNENTFIKAIIPINNIVFSIEKFIIPIARENYLMNVVGKLFNEN